MNGTVTQAHTDVVVVGGGPVGMLVAAELAAFGVRTTVVEAATRTPDQPKAGTVHARAVQSLVRRGYLPGVYAPGAVSESEPFHFAGLPVLNISVPKGEPRPILKRAQADLEREFEARAAERGARIVRGYRVTEVRQGPDGVEVTAEGPDGALVCSGQYLVGADGARSTVRERLGFTADTSPATVSALMGLVRFPDPDAVPRGWQRTPRGWTVARVGADGMGLIRTLDCAGPHPDRSARPTVAELSAEASRIAGHPIAMTDPVHITRFGDYTRLVHHYRQGRAFLAGDAAHVHLPIGGQGLSTGLLDGLNLAWKLAHAVLGTAGEDLLDSYEAERRPAARRVVDNTRAQLALMREGGEVDPLREVFAQLLALEQADHLISDMISGQDTAYPARTPGGSVWEGTFLANLPLHLADGPSDLVRLLGGTRSLLLVRSQAGEFAEQARPWQDVLRTVTVRGTLPCAALLVRPDGHVAWAADGGGPLAEALRSWFGERHR
ncbi:FAD-dependent monooxygenase [Streptomyces xanthochromogenes]|uniref:FAD-dependent monooxygenase n=1 Tax=Streptomyces xanthochromogenes TaxID=67384 RepID=UPI00342E337F